MLYGDLLILISTFHASNSTEHAFLEEQF
jgi:hypothetical protein